MIILICQALLPDSSKLLFDIVGAVHSRKSLFLIALIISLMCYFIASYESDNVQTNYEENVDWDMEADLAEDAERERAADQDARRNEYLYAEE